jgi:hypothetical protein
MTVRLSNRGPSLSDEVLTVAEIDARLVRARYDRKQAGGDAHAAELAGIRIDQLLDARLFAALEAAQ